MPQLKDYKNCHKKQDIYVLASGKSVDFIPNSFFENKIIIGVNQVYKKVECKYLLRKECKLIKEVLNSAPKSMHFISKGNCGEENSMNETYIKNNVTNTSNIVVYNHNVNKNNPPDTLPDDNSLVVSHSTITTAIHLACYMGAKNILLVGHDGGMINGECNFEGYHTDNTYKIAWKKGVEEYKKWVSQIDNHTSVLKDKLSNKYKCNICSINPFINFNLEGNKYTRM